MLPEIYQTTNDRFNKAVWANAGTVATSPVLQVRLGTSGAYRVGDINFEREALSAETSQSPLASPSLRTNRTGRSVGSTVVSSRCQSPSAWNKMHLVTDSAIGLLVTCHVCVCVCVCVCARARTCVSESKRVSLITS